MKLKYLQTNSKLSSSNVYTYAFNLPAIDTCPGAGICREYCFAAAEQRRYPSARAHRLESLLLSKSEEFIPTMLSELDKLRILHRGIRNTHFAVRIHASGDFYSPEYINKWLTIIEMRPGIQFYAYTKSIAMWERIQRLHTLPDNFRLIYSLGGSTDKLVDLEHDRHARIFNTEREALDAGYLLANEDDTVAWRGSSNKIGLVIFGATKKFKQATNSQGEAK